MWAQLGDEAACLVGVERLPVQVKSSVGGEIAFVRHASQLDRIRQTRGYDVDCMEVLVLNGARGLQDVRIDCVFGLVQLAGLELSTHGPTRQLITYCFHPEVAQAALHRIENTHLRRRKGFEHTVWPDRVIQGTVVQLPAQIMPGYNRDKGGGERN